MESEALLLVLAIGTVIGFLAGRNWAEFARARHDGRKSMRSRRDYRR